jgi:hypothetical protein
VPSQEIIGRSQALRGKAPLSSSSEKHDGECNNAGQKFGLPQLDICTCALIKTKLHI